LNILCLIKHYYNNSFIWACNVYEVLCIIALAMTPRNDADFD
jgi:hypothetical protein